MIERTLVVVKPDGVKRGLADEIISRYKKAGLKVVVKKSLQIDREFAGEHYAATDEQLMGMGARTMDEAKKTNRVEETKKMFGTIDEKKLGAIFREFLIDFITSGPVVALVLEGEDAIKRTREITGNTDPSKAAKGTVRGDFGQDDVLKANLEKRAIRNLVHASGNKEEAEREITLWFGKDFI